jgi:MFS transporter, DHA1 family, multidrug resistance protein
MQLKPDTLALTLLLALLTSLGPLATDMYLPSLPAIAEDFGASISGVQITLSLFLIGFAVGQLIYGPVADRFGRRPVLITGLGVVLVANLACTLSPSIDVLMWSRFVQGIGTAGPIVLARSVIRDLYSGKRTGEELAKVAALMGFVPAIAPTLGSVIHVYFGWRMTFLAQTALVIVALLVVVMALPETNRHKRPEPLTFSSYPKIYMGLTQNRLYLVYVAGLCFAYAGLFSFISVSSFVLQSIYGWDPFAFGIAFGVCSLAYVAGTWLSRGFARNRGINATIRAGSLMLVVSGGTMTALLATGFDDPYSITAAMMINMAGIGFTLPHNLAGGLSLFPERAGAASSFLGFSQMASGAAVGILVGYLTSDSAWPMAIAILLSGLLAALVSWRFLGGNAP